MRKEGLTSIVAPFDDTETEGVHTTSAVLLHKCFENVLSNDLSLVFNPSILAALLGHDIPSGSMASEEVLNLDDFTFPLDKFRDGLYVDETDKKLKKREGFSVYISKGFKDHQFPFGIGSFTVNALLDSNIFTTKFLPNVWTEHEKEFKSLRFPMTCSVKGCSASRIMSFKEIRETSGGRETRAAQSMIVAGIRTLTNEVINISSQAVDLSHHEVVFTQRLSGTQSTHTHSIANGVLMRNHIPYNVENLEQSVSGSHVSIQKSKLAKRCDILALPEEFRPSLNLIRQCKQPSQGKSSNSLQSHTARPMLDFTQQQSALNKELGAGVFGQSAANATSFQVKNDRQRELNIQQYNDCSTPWRIPSDIQGSVPTNTIEARKFSMATRLGLLSSRIDEEARMNNPKNADIMQCLGLHPGSTLDAIYIILKFT